MPSAFGVDGKYKLAKVNKNGSFKQRFFEIVVFKYTFVNTSTNVDLTAFSIKLIQLIQLHLYISCIYYPTSL